MNSHKTISILIFCTSVLQNICFAQSQQKQLDTLQVEIIKEYQPSLSGAMKITENPTIKDTLSIKPDLKYSIQDAQIKTTFHVDTIQAVKIKGEPLVKLYSSNIKMAIGNYWTPYSEVVFSTLRSRDYSAGARLKHLSSAGQINNRGYSGYSDNLINVYGKKFFYFSTLSGNFSYNNDALHYYGYNPADSLSVYQASNDIKPKDTNDTFKAHKGLNERLNRDNIRQRFSLFNGRVNFSSGVSDSNRVRYESDLLFRNLTDLYNTVESNVRFSASGGRYIGKELLLVNVEADHYINSFDASPDISNTIIKLNPIVSSNGKQYRFDVGLNAFTDMVSQSTTRYYFYPHVYFSYNVFNEYFIPYASISGNLYKNSIYSLTRENPFLNTRYMPRNSYTEFVSLKGGVKGSLSKFTTYNAEVSNEDLKNQYFFINDYSDSIGNKFTVLYKDVPVLKVTGELLHHFSNKLKGVVHAVYTRYTFDSADIFKPYHKPSLAITCSGFYNLRDKIKIHADLYGSDGFYALKKDGANLKVDGFIDLNLGAEYAYSHYLSAFVLLNNITASKYDRFYNYPVQRFQFLAGLSVSF